MDDRSKAGGRDRGEVSAIDDYEVRDFAEKHGISIEQVRILIERHGNERQELEKVVGRINS